MQLPSPQHELEELISQDNLGVVVRYSDVILLRKKGTGLFADTVLAGIIGDIEKARNDELLFVQAVGGANPMHAEVAVDGRVRLVIEYLLN